MRLSIIERHVYKRLNVALLHLLSSLEDFTEGRVQLIFGNLAMTYIGHFGQSAC